MPIVLDLFYAVLIIPGEGAIRAVLGIGPAGLIAIGVIGEDPLPDRGRGVGPVECPSIRIHSLKRILADIRIRRQIRRIVHASIPLAIQVLPEDGIRALPHTGPGITVPCPAGGHVTH